MDVRKQVYDLTREDLETCPVWEFALDEEGEEGQDEATVKPRPDLIGGVDPGEGMLVVRARFQAANGSRFEGFLTPSDDSGPRALGSIQPTVITAGGQVGFWFGMVSPDREELAMQYEALGASGPADLFPLSFESLVPMDGRPIEGEVPAFLVLDEKLAVQQVT